MGFNISGLAINKNYENDFYDLARQLGWKLERHADIDFETASANWKDDAYCDVYFTENGTLIFLSLDRLPVRNVKNDSSLIFAISETSMAFDMSYYEAGIELRSIMEVNGEQLEDKGDKLKVEDISSDTSEIIWNQLEVVLGKRFWDIEPEEKAIRYVFKKVKTSAGTSKPKKTKADESEKKKEVAWRYISLFITLGFFGLIFFANDIFLKSEQPKVSWTTQRLESPLKGDYYLFCSSRRAITFKVDSVTIDSILFDAPADKTKYFKSGREQRAYIDTTNKIKKVWLKRSILKDALYKDDNFHPIPIEELEYFFKNRKIYIPAIDRKGYPMSNIKFG
ncbi:MAG: hypothetical protein AAF554_16965 [Bacteroidota bacterium]